MKNRKTGPFKPIKELEPVDPILLHDYEQEMANDAIPRIVSEVEKRRMLAAESRLRRMETPAADNATSPK